MPKLKNKVPSYGLHKPSGQAVVTLNGRDIYLGAHNIADSREAYQAALSEWLASHRQCPTTASRERAGTPANGLTVDKIFLAYWDFVQEHYRNYDRPTSGVASIKRALMPLLKPYGRRVSILARGRKPHSGAILRDINDTKLSPHSCRFGLKWSPCICTYGSFWSSRWREG